MNKTTKATQQALATVRQLTAATIAAQQEQRNPYVQAWLRHPVRISFGAGGECPHCDYGCEHCSGAGHQATAATVRG